MIVNEMGKISALKDLESNRRVRKKMHVQIKKTITHSEEAYERSSQCAETETNKDIELLWMRRSQLFFLYDLDCFFSLGVFFKDFASFTLMF